MRNAPIHATISRKSARRVFLFVAVAILGTSSGSAAQAERANNVFLMGAAEYFGIDAKEVQVLAEWGLSPEEMSVILFVAKEGGVSPDAVLSMRRNGQPWSAVTERFRVRPRAFFSREAAEISPEIASAHGRVQSDPGVGWEALGLGDREVVMIVNTVFISRYLERPPGEVLSAYREHGGFVEAFVSLIRRS